MKRLISLSACCTVPAAGRSSVAAQSTSARVQGATDSRYVGAKHQGRECHCDETECAGRGRLARLHQSCYDAPRWGRPLSSLLSLTRRAAR
eukprot:scaffold102707_cov67-Phaeocystis_antarctica.AAC.3